jgi:hypothetical protein
MDIVLTPLMLAAIPVVLGVVSVIKTAGLPDRWAPSVSLILGLGTAFLVGGASIATIVLGGLIIGLSASGLYSGPKATFKPSETVVSTV